MQTKQAVMLVGFGGPRSMGEVKDFLDSVLAGVRIPEARYQEVWHHYEIFDGISLYNEVTEKQRVALVDYLKHRGVEIPVVVGLLHTFPRIAEALALLKEQGVTRVVVFILAPHRSQASFDKYQARVLEAKNQLGYEELEIVYTDYFGEQPEWVEAQASRVRECVASHPGWDWDQTCTLFSAHSIPVAMSEKSGYDQQIRQSSKLVAEALSIKHWQVVYQSRSGNPRDPWLEPDIKDFMDSVSREDFSSFLVVPIGFLNDNIEVLYDLDTEAKACAQNKGFRYFRAHAVADERSFIRLIARQIQEKLQG